MMSVSSGYCTSIIAIKKKNSERIDKKIRQTSKVFNVERMKFPVNFSEINKFENHNS